jgi:hypothetical protein
MDDFQTILYIVVGIIYFLARALKKKKPPVKPSRPAQDMDEDVPQASPPKPLSFEDLLREFTEGKQPEEEEEPLPVPTLAPVPVQRSTSPMTSRYEEDDDEIMEPAQRRYADDDSRRIIEAASKSTQNLTENHSTEPEYGFKRYEDHPEEETTLGAEVAAMLKDADGARKAIILSEILTRKY